MIAEIRKFVGKFVKSPVKTAVVVYLIYKILKKNTKAEGLYESVIVSTDGDKELIFDTKLKVWVVLKKNKIVYSGTNKGEAERKFKEFSNMWGACFRNSKQLKQQYPNGKIMQINYSDYVELNGHVIFEYNNKVYDYVIREQKKPYSLIKQYEVNRGVFDKNKYYKALGIKASEMKLKGEKIKMEKYKETLDRMYREGTNDDVRLGVAIRKIVEQAADKLKKVDTKNTSWTSHEVMSYAKRYIDSRFR